MNNKVYILAIILPCLLIFFSGCSKIGDSSAQNEVVFDDGYKAPAKDEVVINDALFQDHQNSTEGFNNKSREKTQIIKDGSTIDTTYDGFGNKTEKRTFNGDPLLNLIMLRSGIDGNKKVFVYAKNGEVKNLPEEMIEKILTASPDELANAAGIFEGVKEPGFIQSNQPPTVTALKPLPSSQFPIRNRQVGQTPTLEAEEPSAEIEQPQSAENKQDNEPPAKSEAQIKLNKKSDK